MRLLVFDSGIGGLGIVAALRQVLPDATIAFVADNAAFPYGEKPDDWLIARIEAVIAAAIARFRPALVVVACNTASTLALAALRARFDIPFVGVVPPIKWAAAESRTRTIGLLATAATVRRGYLADLQAQYAPDCRLVAHGARDLADLAEQRFLAPDVASPALDAAILRELTRLFAQPGGAEIDAVAIGCTHYSFLLDLLADAATAAQHPVIWLDPAEPVARHAARLIGALELTDATGPDVAAFTARPDDAEAMRRGLSQYGFDGLELLEVALAPRA